MSARSARSSAQDITQDDIMKPPIIVSSSDLERLEGLLTLPAFRSRSDLDGLREELERAGREYELTLAYPKDANAEARRVSIFSPAGSALLGLATGQSIDWTTPDGKELHLKVLEVTWQPEANGQFDL